MEELIRNFNDEREFNYSIHISDEFKFIYFNNPKCACTTIKATLNLSAATAAAKTIKYNGMQDIHDRNKNLLQSPKMVGYESFLCKLEDAAYFKFCFIRDPVDRVVSAFQNKMTWNSQFRIAVNRFLARPEQAEVSFEQFASALASDEKIRDMDEHWRLQRKQICLDFVQFDKIGLFENLEADLLVVLSRIFGKQIELDIFDARKHFPENVSNSGRIRSSMSAEVHALLLRAYKDDVELHSALVKRSCETPAPYAK